MNKWLEQCENWLVEQYKNVLDLSLEDGDVNLRWLEADSLTGESKKDEAHGLVIEDGEIGCLLYLLPYDSSKLESQINQALGLRSRLLRESNYTGNAEVGKNEDKDSSWRVGLVWLVEENEWEDWQSNILNLRRESGAAEEISIDVIKIKQDDACAALDGHGLSRLLLHTRALLTQTVSEAETWLSADEQVSLELEGFSQQFKTSRARAFARELEEQFKNIKKVETHTKPTVARKFSRFHVKNFRNLQSMEVVADSASDNKAQAIVLLGPNGTGKSSFAEALSLAAFNTSPRLEKFLGDKDLSRVTADTYLNNYLTPINNNSEEKPSFSWDNGESYEETPFVLNTDDDSKRRFDGVVLNQEDSMLFSDMPREKLAEQILKGYSSLADGLSDWLLNEENRIKEIKSRFTRQYNLNGSITKSVTAYDRLAKMLLADQLQRVSPEFVDWLRFIEKLSSEDGEIASALLIDLSNQQSDVVNRLSEAISKLQEIGATSFDIGKAIKDQLDEYSVLAVKLSDFHQNLKSKTVLLHEKLDVSLTQIESWGVWLSSQTIVSRDIDVETQELELEIKNLSKERVELEKNGKSYKGRLDLLDQAKQYLSSHWSAEHPDDCPVCNSDVSNRNGIDAVVSMLQEETNTTIQTLRARFVDIQSKQKELDLKLKAAGASICPVALDDQLYLKELLKPFLRDDSQLEDLLVHEQYRKQLREDLSRMKVLPDAPRPYADSNLEAERLAKGFIDLAQQADNALEDPQAIGEVKKAFQLRMENILKDHLPSTLGKVWQELAMTLTTASWLLPDLPKFKLELRGKSLSVQTSKGGQYVRYI